MKFSNHFSDSDSDAFAKFSARKKQQTKKAKKKQISSDSEDESEESENNDSDQNNVSISLDTIKKKYGSVRKPPRRRDSDKSDKDEVSILNYFAAQQFQNARPFYQ